MSKYILPLPPPINSTYRAAYRPNLGRTAFFMDSKAKDWKTEAQWLLKKESKLIEGEVAVSVIWYLRRDRDVDSGLKLLLDALQGALIVDDAQVIVLHASKVKAEKEPHCEIEVNEV